MFATTLVPGCINPSKINMDITVQSHISYPIINHKCDLSSHIYMAAILQASAAVEVTATSATLYSQRPSTSVAKKLGQLYIIATHCNYSHISAISLTWDQVTTRWQKHQHSNHTSAMSSPDCTMISCSEQDS